MADIEPMDTDVARPGNVARACTIMFPGSDGIMFPGGDGIVFPGSDGGGGITDDGAPLEDMGIDAGHGARKRRRGDVDNDAYDRTVTVTNRKCVDDVDGAIAERDDLLDEQHYARMTESALSRDNRDENYYKKVSIGLWNVTNAFMQDLASAFLVYCYQNYQLKGPGLLWIPVEGFRDAATKARHDHAADPLGALEDGKLPLLGQAHYLSVDEMSRTVPWGEVGDRPTYVYVRRHIEGHPQSSIGPLDPARKCVVLFTFPSQFCFPTGEDVEEEMNAQRLEECGGDTDEYLRRYLAFHLPSQRRYNTWAFTPQNSDGRIDVTDERLQADTQIVFSGLSEEGRAVVSEFMDKRANNNATAMI